MALHEVSPGQASGSELAYAEITADVTVSATTEASPTTIVTCPAFRLDAAARIYAEFYTACVDYTGTGGGSDTILDLWEAAQVFRLAQLSVGTSNATFRVPVLARYFATLAAGTYTYSVRGYRTTNNALVRCSTDHAPTYLRIAKA